MLPSPGIVWLFRSYAYSILYLQYLQHDDIDESIETVADAILTDIKCLQKEKDFYNSRLGYTQRQIYEKARRLVGT